VRPDGRNLELLCWGLRNPFRIKFDRDGTLYAANHGMEDRGSRPWATRPTNSGLSPRRMVRLAGLRRRAAGDAPSFRACQRGDAILPAQKAPDGAASASDAV
jgi:hypothetical protein